MKFATPFTLAGFVATAAAATSTVQFVAESANSTLNNHGFAALHEGAGFSYVFFNPSAENIEFTWDESLGYLTNGDANFAILQSAPASLGPAVTPSVFSIENGYLKTEGMTTFYGCLNVNDPYRYSEQYYALVLNTTLSTNLACMPLKLKVHGGLASSSPSPSPSQTATSSPNPWHNTTITTQSTVTDYTTYCPNPTTITITTCGPHTCHPTTVNVPSPTTVVISGTVVVPTGSTTSPKPSSTESPTSSQMTTVAAESTSATSTSATVQSQEGSGSKNTFGVVAFVAVAAMLL